MADGPLKRVDENTWIHVICAMFSDQYYIHNFDSIEIRKIPEKDLSNEKRRVKQRHCEHCTGTGFNNLVKCQHEGCNKYSHVYCLVKNRAIQDRNKEKIDDIPDGLYWGFSLILNDIDFEKKLHSKYQPPLYNVNIKRILEFVEKVNKAITDDPNLDPKKGEDHILKKRRGKKSISALQTDDPFISNILSNIVERSSSIVKAVEDEEGLFQNPLYELKNIVSKRISVQCTHHKEPEKYCICENSNNSEESFMIACDACGKSFLQLKVFIISKIH